jgi:hypothetical protein
MRCGKSACGQSRLSVLVCANVCVLFVHRDSEEEYTLPVSSYQEI